MKLWFKKSYLYNRIGALFLSIVLLIPICGAMSIVGVCNQASLESVYEIKPGYSYIVRMNLDSPTKEYEGYLEYDTSILTLTKIVPAKSDLDVDFQVIREEGYVRVSYSQPVSQVLQLTFYVSPHAPIGAEPSVKFTSAFAGSGSGMVALDDVSFSFLVVDQKSSDSSLKALNLAVFHSASDRDSDTNPFYALISPSFDSDQTIYSATVANEYSHFSVSATANDAMATVSNISSGELTEGMVTNVVITVRAEDGTETVYTVQVFRERSNPSVDVSDPPPEDSSDESSAEDSSEFSEQDSSIPSDASEESEESSMMSSDSSDITDSNASVDASSQNETSSRESSEHHSLEIPSFSDGSSIDHTSGPDNVTEILFLIAALSGLIIAALLIRILLIIRRKRK